MKESLGSVIAEKENNGKNNSAQIEIKLDFFMFFII